MKGKLIVSERLAAHIQQPGPDENYYFCRLFATPVGEIDEETGQAFKPYIATFLIVRKGDSGEVQGALTLPRAAALSLRALGRELGLKTIWWQSWDFDLAAKKWRKLEPVTIRI